MFQYCSPEAAGVSSKRVLKLLKTLDSYGFNTHSVLMLRGNQIFTECYYQPFHKDFLHRMYSVSKTFVSVAIGLAQDDGLLRLNDPIIRYFPSYVKENQGQRFCEATIRDLLRMESAYYDTGSEHGYWFGARTDDRVKEYFRYQDEKIPGTAYTYDSSGSFILSTIVELVTGKPFLEYMREKFLRDIGFSEEAYCLKVPGGHSFGDSGIMCTAKDLLLFAKFVMNLGEWNGKQYINRAYMEEAVSRQVCNDMFGFQDFSSSGYGYQIWRAPENCFAFCGMGDQYALCDPDHDFIFVINSDNQGCTSSKALLFQAVYENIIHQLSDSLPENDTDLEHLMQYVTHAKLNHFDAGHQTDFPSKIHGITYCLDPNPMGMDVVRFTFEGKKGTMHYRNRQGEKELVFGIGYNEFSEFPESGYSDMIAGQPADGNKYQCACSGCWTEPQKLILKLQIIDKYFGTGCFVFGFKDSRVTIMMHKTAEDFLCEYHGIAVGYAISES